MNVALVQQAMSSQPPRMIAFTYSKTTGNQETEMYTVEPYEIDAAQGIFWGYKINDPKPGIRKFFMNLISGEQMLPQVFTPRWQLYPYGK